MQREAQTHREWGQWPGRRPAENGGRDRLRALFASSAAPESETPVDPGLSALKRAYAELDDRERRVQKLESNLEQLLRDDAAELDRRQAALDTREVGLDLRTNELEASEAAVEARRRELGAVELRRAALERREEVVRAREEALEHRAEELASLARSVTELGEVLVADSEADGDREQQDEHVVLDATDRYLVRVGSGPAPRIGSLVQLEDGDRVCVALTRSPFPADRRRCAVLERVPPAVQPSQASSSASPKNSPITPPAASAGT